MRPLPHGRHQLAVIGIEAVGNIPLLGSHDTLVVVFQFTLQFVIGSLLREWQQGGQIFCSQNHILGPTKAGIRVSEPAGNSRHYKQEGKHEQKMAAGCSGS